ncbi:hypothetical protein NKH18_49640 [Streptomyces sp. M10(2022)]
MIVAEKTSVTVTFAPRSVDISFAVAYLLLYHMASPTIPVERIRGGAASQWRDLTTGLRNLVTGNTAVRVGVLTSTVVNFVFGAYEPMVVYRMRHGLGLGAGTVGLVFAVSGVTSVAVAVLLSWKAPSRGYLVVMGLSVALQGFAVAGLGVFTSLAAVITAQVAFATGTVLDPRTALRRHAGGPGADGRARLEQPMRAGQRLTGQALASARHPGSLRLDHHEECVERAATAGRFRLSDSGKT